MLTKKELLKQPEYWIEEIQNELFRQATDYMQQKHYNQNQLAHEWGVTKGYISQILKGDCNFTLKKLAEISLLMGKAPVLNFIPTDFLYELELISDSVLAYCDSLNNSNASTLLLKIEISKQSKFVSCVELKRFDVLNISEVA